MTTQEPLGLDFRILPESEHEQFRLLELPPELLEFVTANPPTSLCFKSRDPNAHAEGADNNAVLCTPSKTYHIRQVNHSNSMYITRPCAAEDPDDGTQRYTAEAFATSGFVFEIVPAPPTTDSATSHLKAALPVYTSTHSHPLDRANLQNRQQHFENIPLSDHECAEAWNELACFELGNPPIAFRPSAAIRMRAWMAILNCSLERGIDLTSTMDSNHIKVLSEADEEVPCELTTAILTNMRGESTAIDADQCVRFVGASHLEERTVTAGHTALSGFLETWRDAVPEKWRGRVEVDLLKGICAINQSDQTIAFTGNTTMQSNNIQLTDAAKSAQGTKRNWHDKFRARKKTS